MENQTMICGRHPVMEAVSAGKVFDKIFFQQGITGEFEKEVRKTCREFDIPVSIVPKEKMGKMAPGINHQGIVGFLALVAYQKIEDLLPMIYEKAETPLLILLDGVTDVRNLGAIARSAACCGAQGLVVPTKNTALINAEAIKASAGALLQLPVCRENSLANAIDFLKLSGVQVFASDLNARAMIFDCDLTQPTAIVMGAEDTGVNPAFVRMANQRFRIPQAGTMDSFNVSVATGIILYEALRQRLR